MRFYLLEKRSVIRRYSTPFPRFGYRILCSVALDCSFSGTRFVNPRYFFYKAPLLISRVVGFATLFSTLFCLGTLARSRELTAIRASGITVQRIALPLLILSLFICGCTFIWNETLVPAFTHRAQDIY